MVNHHNTLKIMDIFLVPEAGLEPARPLGTRDFKSLASTNSATPADEGFLKKQRVTGVIEYHKLS
jgi:hypothetical protein